ncbi:hypothetical protein SAMN02745148_00728 [Modicisalibacter ilicicola DSM 19980]|uniref:Uncharacterized protein n=1 Tax=Modicisalibacter ilicicola DSM 19980 TaxID=1121942 RepID=A0A1M4UR09_9GAMM|nr:hypothetical protein SAMN02745148_00728 [Halomonas ilicicola DSM 19980]
MHVVENVGSIDIVDTLPTTIGGDGIGELVGGPVAGLEARPLVSLVAATDDAEVATACELAADRPQVVDLVAPVAAVAEQPAAGFLFVEGVVLVVGGQQLDVVARVQIGLVAGAGVASNQASSLALKGMSSRPLPFSLSSATSMASASPNTDSY